MSLKPEASIYIWNPMCVECLKREVLDLASKQQSASESSVQSDDLFICSFLIYSTDASVFAFI